MGDDSEFSFGPVRDSKETSIALEEEKEAMLDAEPVVDGSSEISRRSSANESVEDELTKVDGRDETEESYEDGAAGAEGQNNTEAAEYVEEPSTVEAPVVKEGFATELQTTLPESADAFNEEFVATRKEDLALDSAMP